MLTRFLLLSIFLTSLLIPLVEAEASQSIGERSLAVIAMDFPDMPMDVPPTFIGNTLSQLFTEYFSEVSYGRFSVSIKLFGWVRASGPWGDYESYTYDRERAHGMLIEAIQLAGINITQYDMVMLLHSGPWGGRGSVVATREGVDAYGVVRYAILSYSSPAAAFVYAVLIMLGLNDLGHSTSGWTPTGPWTVAEEPPHILGWEKYRLGWLSGDSVMELLRGSTKSLSLSRSSATSGIKVVIMPLDPNSYLVVEYRVADGVDSSVPSNGILTYIVSTGLIGSGYAVDVVATLWEGEVYIDASRDVGVSVSSIGLYSAEITVSNGLPDPYIREVRFEGEILPSRTAKAVVVVGNKGSSPSQKLTLKMLIDGVEVRREVLDELDPGQLVEVSYEWSARPGVNRVEVYITAVGLLDRDPENNRVIAEVSAPSAVILEDFRAGRLRYDVGSEATIMLRFVRDSDRRPAVGAVIEYAGRQYTVGDDGWVNMTISSISVGKVEVVPSLVRYYSIEKLILEVTPTLIFDKVEITNFKANRSRLNVGEAAEIRVFASYAYDGRPFDGKIIINNDIEVLSDVGYFVWRMDEVGEALFRVTGIVDERYGLSSYTRAELHVVWDRVSINLTVKDDRINVGETATISWTARYEYDGEPFVGEIVLSNPRPVMDQPGSMEVYVLSIKDEKYGLTAFSSNVIRIVWDRVRVKLSSPYERVEVGSRAPISIEAFYEYDGSRFDGQVQLSGTLSSSLVRRSIITATSVNGGSYGITKVISNSLEIVFDDYEYEVWFDSSVPGSLTVYLRLRYMSDGAPVYARVLVSNSTLAGREGVYRFETPFWGLIYDQEAVIKVAGFRDRKINLSSPHVTNILLYVSTFSVVGLLAYKKLPNVRVRKRGNEEEVEEIPTLEEL